MAYDPSKDRQLHVWENQETGLLVSIYRYGDGEPKVQIGPRKYVKRDGTERTTKAGRLGIDDVLWLSEILEEVKEKMGEYLLEEG